MSDKQASAERLVDQLGYHVDHGVTDFALTGLTPVEVYDALIWALDEVADLREEVATARDSAADEVAALVADLDLAMYELDQPLERDYIDYLSDDLAAGINY